MTKNCCEDPKNHKKELLNRLARVEGHLKKVRSMVEDDAYCIDTITQSLAVQSALQSVDRLILARHMETCVKDAFESKVGVEEKIAEILKVTKFANR